MPYKDREVARIKQIGYSQRYRDKNRPLRRLFWVWCEMRRRCFDHNNKTFKNYGARGITVCERWFSFKNFVADMGPKPDGTSLDRINNNGNYEPSNCRWATSKQQNSNRRNCIYVELADEKVTLKEACRRKGLKYRPVVKRIQYRGWSIERALSTPIREANRGHS